MKKTIVMLLTVATMIGCLTAPVVAVSFKMTKKWMKTFYYNSYMADQGHASFKRSQPLSNPQDYRTTVRMCVWLTGKDGVKRGTRSIYTYIETNSCGSTSYPIDHDYKNTPNGLCEYFKQEPLKK